MEKNNYKYSITVSTAVIDSNISFLDEEEDPIIDEKLIEVPIIDNNLLKARENAFAFIKWWKKENDPSDYPLGKFDDFTTDKDGLWKFYQIKVYFENEDTDESYCIFDDDDGANGDGGAWANSLIFEELIKEYKIYKKLKIDVSKIEKSVNYLDNKLNKKLKATILPNGMDLSDMFIGVKHIDLGKIRTKEEKPVHDSIQSKTNKKINYISSIKHRIKANNDDIEFSIRTTSESIPLAIQKDIAKLIKKWQNMNNSAKS